MHLYLLRYDVRRITLELVVSHVLLGCLYSCEVSGVLCLIIGPGKVKSGPLHLALLAGGPAEVGFGQATGVLLEVVPGGRIVSGGGKRL